jgi:hypothetical protein
MSSRPAWRDDRLEKRGTPEFYSKKDAGKAQGAGRQSERTSPKWACTQSSEKRVAR